MTTMFWRMASISGLLVAMIIVLLATCTFSHAQPHGMYYDGKAYRPCPRVDPYCELLPRQGEPLQPTPREKREVWNAARDLAIAKREIQRYRQFDPYEGRLSPPPPPPPRQARPNQQQWKEAIIQEANKYCNSFPNDAICHFKEPLPNDRPSTEPPH